MYFKILLFLHLYGLYLSQIALPFAEKLILNPCTIYQTCSSCLTSPQCSWCVQNAYETMGPRCDYQDNHSNRGCSVENIMNPKTSLKIMKNEELSITGAVEGFVVQLKPQQIKLSLRPKEPVTFQATFRQAEDYPVDLYYLMDLTWSMKEHKDQLAQLADLIGVQMLNITKNFRLGFGSFIDKVVMPFADMTPERLINPCRDATCSSPYGFHNHLPLTKNVSLFTEEVSSANLSGNLDNAEGGFDAIMQTIMCKDHIKWNDQSRKIILFATDSIFHYAGDGKLGGIVKPNDGLCHLSPEGFYTESIHQDYPSLSQINQKLKEHKVNMIFAVPQNKVPVYKQLTSHIEGSYIGILTDDSSNIVNIIHEQYDKIRSEIELVDDAPDFLKISYFTNCLEESKEETEMNTCGGITVGATVNFTVKIELISCPKDQSLWNQKIVVSPVGLRDTVTIDLDYLCQCECEKPNYQEANSQHCSSNGTFECGVCSCNMNHYGRECECLGDEITRNDKLAFCKRFPQSNELCSGHGNCLCGKCECNSPNVYGKYCECDTVSCERDSNGEVCGGPSRGQCCDVCLCNPGWTGPACECPLSTDTCLAPGDDTRLCSGHGDCDCGRCRCHRDKNGYYGGLHCEDCSTCEGKCEVLKPCVLCQVFQSGTLSEEECKMNCTVPLKDVPQALEETPYDKRCIYKDSDDCSFTFIYRYDTSNELMVIAERLKDCPEAVNLYLIVFGVATSIVLVGLLILLLLRFCIYLKDKRDYEKFLQDVTTTQWGEEINPIYKNATSLYKNPLYDSSIPNTHHTD